LRDSLGTEFAAVMLALQRRASVFVRVNLARIDREAAVRLLAGEGIAAVAHPLAKTALEVVENARKIQMCSAYLEGLIELQDAASQAVVEALPLRGGMRVLDHCAGGGGKALAMAAAARIEVFAHDAEPRRMRDLPARAARAGMEVQIVDDPAISAPYDLILTDVPCSGSGSWRRDPQGKWALTAERLAAVCAIQAGILDRVAPMVARNGVLAYATCSLLYEENEAQVAGFLARHPGWIRQFERRFSPLQGGDGFFVAIFTRLI
jgi:16S rRNA (cytosine967-C5)-methyltransferase